MRYRGFVFVGAVVAAFFLIGYVVSPLRAPSSPEKASAPSSLQDAVRKIEAGTRTSPIVGDQPRRGLPTLTFLAKADAKNVPRIVSDVTGWGERADGTFDFNSGKMTRIVGTDWYSLETKVEPYARIEYLIAYGAGDYRIDPYNPRKVQRAGGPGSEIVMPGYVPPQEFIDPQSQPAGNVVETLVDSRILGGPRRVITYTPTGYHGGGAYPIVVFHDGALMVNTGEAPRVLDWLIAHKAIPPVVAVFVDPKSRVDDYRRGSAVRTFVTDELLPWMSSRYSLTKDADQRAIIGMSAGARGALDTVVSSPLFNRLGLLIPALDAADIHAIPEHGRRQLHLSIIAAHYDALNLAAARGAQLTAADRGHIVDFKEVPEGHATQTWRTHLRDVLISLFGAAKR